MKTDSIPMAESKIMTLNSESRFTCKNSASFGIYSNSSATQMEQMRKNCVRKRKFKFWVALVIFIFFTFLIILLVLDILNSTKTIKNVKTKRYVQSNDLDFYEDIKTVRRISEEKITNDVRIVPENSQDNRRMSRYPNHRYDAMESKDKLYEKMMKEVYVENGWYPKPLKGRGGPLNNIQDIISRGRTSGEEGRKRSKVTNQFGSPIRLDGVYIRTANEKDKSKNGDRKNEENYKYLKQINDLIQSDSVDDDEEGSWIPANPFKNRGSPFRKPAKGANIPQQYESNQGKRKNQLSKSELEKEKEVSPITILLDFRSESETGDNEKRNDGSEGKEFVIKRKPKNEIIYIPINSRNAFHDSMVGSETKFPVNSKYFKNKNLNNMVIKLNLYPRKGNWKRRHSQPHFEKAIPPTRTKIGERRTFGLFSKHKKKMNFKKCPIFDLKPQGHTIKAKWKNKNGEWIHSENVVVNRYKDEWKR